MHCNKVQEKLYDFLEDLLSDTDRIAVESHLESCQTCQRAMDTNKVILQLENYIPEVEPPRYLAERMAALFVKKYKPGHTFLGWLGNIPKIQYAAAVTTAVVLIMVAFSSYQKIKTDLSSELYTAFNKIPRSVVTNTLENETTVSIYDFFQVLSAAKKQNIKTAHNVNSILGGSTQIRFFTMGQAGIEAMALIAAGSETAAMERIQIVRKLLYDMKAPQSLLEEYDTVSYILREKKTSKQHAIDEMVELNDSIKSFAETVDKRAEHGTEQSLFKEKKNNQDTKNIDKKNASPIYFELGIWTAQVHLLASAGEFNSLKLLQNRQGDIVQKMNKAKFHPVGLELMNRVKKEIETSEEITDEKEILSSVDQIRHMISSGTLLN